MSYKQSIILFAVFIIGGLGMLSLVRQGFYPVAFVGWDIVTARSLEKDSSAAYVYYQKAAATYGSNPELLAKPESRLEIKRAALDNLILNTMIYQEINSRLKGGLGKIAEQKLAQFENNANLKESAKALYGLEFSDFKKQVLLPQSYKEILEGRLFLENKNLNDWLVKKRELERVIILSPEFKWQNGAVAAR